MSNSALPKHFFCTISVQLDAISLKTLWVSFVSLLIHSFNQWHILNIFKVSPPLPWAPFEHSVENNFKILRNPIV